MCGIAGLWRFGNRRINHPAFDRFVDSLHHRGPDGRGVWIDDSTGIALGHRRLAILDCTEDGRQPMSYQNGRYWIVFNGEIFNFLELRRELREKGFAFTSETDTEVILAAYIQWGSEMLLRFNGMWALAIYDSGEKSLFMARDRFGIKPFLYQFDSAQFAFASELKSFNFLEGCHPEIDLETARVLLQNIVAVEGTSRTLFKGVRRLQGGHCAVLKEGRLSVRRWWNTLDHLVSPPSRPEEQAERFRELFEDSVRLRMRSDVPVGTCLSGGFDSTAVVCTMARLGSQQGFDRQAREWQQTFVATFPGAENDERVQAEQAIAFAGVKGNFLPMDDSYALRDIDRVLHDLDDVSSTLPTSVWMIYRQLRLKNVYVSLDGHGADELMGAYKPLEFSLLHDAPSWLTHPTANFRRLGEYFALLHASRRPSTFRKKIRAAVWMTLLHHSDFSWLRNWTRPFRRRVIAQKNPFLIPSDLDAGDEFKTVGQDDRLPAEWGPFNRELYPMFHSTVLPTILRNFDRLSMAHGIEIRMPFMDWRLVSYVMSLPDGSKFSNGQTKKVAREAMTGLIPEEIRSSKIKIGFNSPLPRWLSGPLKTWVGDLLQEEHHSAADIVNIPALRTFIRSGNADTLWTWGETHLAWQHINYIWFVDRFAKM